MKRYSVTATVTGGKYIGEFLAKNKKDAEEQAWASDNCYISFCHQCSDECEDGGVSELHIEEVKDGE